MNGQTRSRPAVLWMVVAALAAAYAVWLTAQYDRQSEHLAAANARAQQLFEQVQRVATAVSTTPASAPDELTIALLRRPDLIPLEPVLGGTFYYLEDTLQVLSDRYLYVAVEDGHIMGHMLLEYRTGADGAEFRVLDAYVD